MDCGPPGSSVQGILQARVLEWTAIPFSRGSFQPRDHAQVSCTVDRFFTVWAAGDAQGEQYGTAGRFFTIWATRDTQREQYGSSLKTTITIWSSSLTPGHVSGANSNSERYMHTNVHCSTVYNSKDMEATKVSTDRGMDKDVGHIYNEILLSHKKGWNNAFHNNIDEPRDYHTKWSKSKTNIMYHLYVELKKTDAKELIYKTETDSQT